MASIQTSYIATANSTFSERLIPGYHSAVFTNDSGFYLLLRLGGTDAPSNPASANRIIPPYHEAAVRLNGQYLAGTFTNTPTGVGSNLSTSITGICSAVYTTDKINQNLSPIGGSAQQPIQPPNPTYGKWLRQTKTDTVLQDAPLEIIVGPLVTRKIIIQPIGPIVNDALTKLYVAPQSNPFSISVMLGARTYYFGTEKAYAPPIIFDTAVGGEEFVNLLEGIYVITDKDLGNVFYEVEYIIV